MNTDNFYALDIETDNSEGFGLDPINGRIISIAVVSASGRTWFQQAQQPEGERQMLRDFAELWKELRRQGSAVWVTWNGGAFDFPFLSHRLMVNRVPALFELKLSQDRKPKYEPINGFEGVYAVSDDMGLDIDHLDMAYVMKDWAEARSHSWSLKPTAAFLDFHDSRMDMFRGDSIHSQDTHMVAAYNIHDAKMTLDLALWANEFEGSGELDFGLSGQLDSSVLWV